jgi:hypothetical protein
MSREEREAPVSTNDKMVDGRSDGVPDSAAQRRSIQPVVYVSAKGTQPGGELCRTVCRNVILTALVLLILIALWMFGLLEVEPAVLY